MSVSVIQELRVTQSLRIMSANTVFESKGKVTVAPQSFERFGCYG